MACVRTSNVYTYPYSPFFSEWLFGIIDTFWSCVTNYQGAGRVGYELYPNCGSSGSALGSTSFSLGFEQWTLVTMSSDGSNVRAICAKHSPRLKGFECCRQKRIIHAFRGLSCPHTGLSIRWRRARKHHSDHQCATAAQLQPSDQQLVSRPLLDVQRQHLQRKNEEFQVTSIISIFPAHTHGHTYTHQHTHTHTESTTRI